MNMDQATTLLVGLAEDAVRWRVTTAEDRPVARIREETGAELYNALATLLELPPAPPGLYDAPLLVAPPLQ